jgi:hypothetical protein
MTSKIYTYDPSYKQPDPEIWGNGVVGGQLIVSSGAQESFLRIYNKEITIPNSSTGVISFYGSFIVKASWTGIATHTVTGYITEKRSYSHLNTTEIKVSGSATEKFISREKLDPGSLSTDISSAEKITYDYNLDSSILFSSLDDGTISELSNEIVDYGNISDPLSQGQEDYGNTEILSTTSSSIGTIVFGGYSQYRVLNNEINTALLTFSNNLRESISWNPTEDISTITINGDASNILVSYNPPENKSNLKSSGQLLENITQHYNESSILPLQPSGDYGLVTDSEIDSTDYGLILSPVDQGQSDQGLIIFVETNTPFGTTLLSGSASVKPPSDIRTYRIGSVYRVSYNPPENIASLFNVGNISESFVYDYNEDSIVAFEIENDGSILESITEIDDYGLTENIVNIFEDYDSIEFVEEQTPFGLFNVTGSADSEYTNINFYGPPEAVVRVIYSPDDTTGTLFGFGEKIESVTYDYNEDSIREFVTDDLESISSGVTVTDDYGLVTNIQTIFLDYGLTDDTPLGTTPFGLFNLTGSADSEYTNINFYGYTTGAEVKVVYSPDDTTGTLFGFGEKVESVAYDYSINSIFSVGVPNYGSISDAATILEDYGIVSELHSQTEDNGSILGFSAGEDVIPFGSLTIFGYGDEKHVENYYVDGPTPIVVSSGYSDIQFISQTPEDTSIFTYGGSAVEKNTESYVGSGSLFEVGYITERTTYSYNLDSDVTYDSDSFGLISDSATEISDYGQLTSPISQGNEDFGVVILSDNTESFGSILLFGQSQNEYQIQIPDQTLNINVSGINQERVTYIPLINDKDGEILEQPDIKLTGSSEYSPVIYSEIGSGSLFNIGTIDESVTYDYNESSILGYEIEESGSITDSVTSIVDYGFVDEVYIGEDDNGEVSDTLTIPPFGTINLSGSANTEWINVNIYGPTTGAEVKVVYSPDDTTGTLFGFGEKLESVTYDYNEASDLIVEEIDNGTILDSVTAIEDYGFVDQIYVGEGDFGTVDTITSFAFGSLSITGDAGVEFRNANFFGPPEAIVRVAYSPDDTTGTLFGFGEKLESVTYDYNEDSILFVGVPNYGFIDDPISIVDDYGFVSEIHSSSENYQSLIDPATSVDLYPFGSLTILGSSSIDSRFAESFTGLLDIYGSAYTDYTPKYTSVGSIIVSGSSTVKFTSSEVATDELVISGIKIERRSRSYNESSILTISQQLLDYGTLSATTEVSNDYGFVAEISTENSEELGFISAETISDIYPFGTITISGALIHPDIDYTPKYTASGLISILGSAFESKADDFGSGRRRGGNIRYSGDAETRETANYGYYGNDNDPGTSGTILIGAEGVSIPALLRRTRSYVGIETIILSDSSIERDIEVYVGLGTVTFSGVALESFSAQTPEDTQLFSFYGELNHPNIDYTPHYGIEKNIGVGTTGIQITELSSAQESFSANASESTQLFQIYGSGIESFVANPPENVELFTISGFIDESEIESYVGVAGTITLSGSITEKDTEAYVGIGTLQVFGVVNDSANRIAKGTGSISIINGLSPQESYPWLPEPGVGRSWSFTRTTYIAEPVSINISTGIALTHYYSPIYPRNSGIPGSGIGTIRVNDDKKLTITRAVLPYFAGGGFVVSNSGDESFSKTNYDGSGLITLSGVSSTREIAVYTAVGLGTITLSDSFRIRDVKSYSTGGIIYLGKYELTTQSLGDSSLTFDNDTVGFDDSSSQFVYSEAITTETDAYMGTGTIAVLSGVSDSVIIQPTTNTQLFTIFGSAADAYSAQTPETEVLYQFSGDITERRTYGYEGSGQATFASSAIQRYEPRNVGTGLLRFTTYLSDNLYDTCDSDDITSDNQISAFVSFVSNPPENTVLFNFDGNAVTSESDLYTEFTTGLYTLSGTYQNIQLTHSEFGIGTIFISEASVNNEGDVYVGSGRLTITSKSTDAYSAQTPESTAVVQVSGSALTYVEANYSTVGIGLFDFGGVSDTSQIASYTNVGSGSIKLSGNLVPPNIIFIPTSISSGIITILGSSDNSITKVYEDTPGTLFYFTSGFESFTKSNYTGVGTIYVEDISGSIINNPYQIPRTYVCII